MKKKLSEMVLVFDFFQLILVPKETLIKFLIKFKLLNGYIDVLFFNYIHKKLSSI